MMVVPFSCILKLKPSILLLLLSLLVIFGKLVLPYNSKTDGVMLADRNWEAIHKYSRLIASNPNDVKAYCERGYFYHKIRLFWNEISDSNVALSLDENCAAAFVNRGCARVNLYRFGEALSDFNHAVHLLPNSCLVLEMRALTYELQGEYKNALKDWKKDIELSPQNANAYYHLAVVESKLACNSQAAQHCTTAIELLKEKAKHESRLNLEQAYCLRAALNHRRGQLFLQLSDEVHYQTLRVARLSLAEFRKLIERVHSLARC